MHKFLENYGMHKFLEKHSLKIVIRKRNHEYSSMYWLNESNLQLKPPHLKTTTNEAEMTSQLSLPNI